MIEVVFAEDGDVVSDARIDDWVDSLINRHENSGNLKVRVGASLMFLRLRLAIRRKEINHNEIIFFHDKGNGEVIETELDEEAYHTEPTDIGNELDDWLSELIMV